MKKLPALLSSHVGCLNCGGKPLTLKMNHVLQVGFGTVSLECDGKYVELGDPLNESKPWSVQKAENLARKSPSRDWRIVVWGPLSGFTYQRQGKNLWVLVEKNLGFA
jgi:hypothetical protein